MIKSLESLRVIMLKKLGTAAEEEKNHEKLLEVLKKRIKKLEADKDSHNKKFENLTKLKKEKA